MKRQVQTFTETPLPHVIESETIDYDNRSFHFEVFGHENPHVVTVTWNGVTITRSRDAMREGFERLLDAIKRVPPA